jgi:hypothetical protein
MLFAGVVLAGVAYISSLSHLYIWIGGGVSIFGLLMTGSLSVWDEALISLLNS